MKLKRLRLVSFCGFKDFTLDLGPLTVLVGPNNGGKTTLLRGIQFALYAIQLSLDTCMNNQRQVEAQIEERRKQQAVDRNGLLEQHKREKEQLENRLRNLAQAECDKQRAALATHQTAQLAQMEAQWEAQLRQVRAQWLTDLAPVARQLLIEDLTYLNYGRSTNSFGSIALDVQFLDKQVSVKMQCTREGKIIIDCHLDGTPLASLPKEVKWTLFERLKELKAYTVAPLGTIVPSEKALSWPELAKHLHEGKREDVWRNEIHWLNEGQPLESYQRINDMVARYVGSIQVNPPGRTRESYPKVMLTYKEEGHTYDVAASGAGVRSLLSVASALELSDARIILLDEPDSHLHSLVQRRMAEFLADHSATGKQIVIATHSPDMIEELPLESLVWIDRHEKQGKYCDDSGRMLVDLGAVGHAQAMQFIGGDALLCFEGKGDRHVLAMLLKKCGLGDKIGSWRLTDLGGFGDVNHLANAVRVIEGVRHVNIPVAAFVDSDYSQPDPKAIATVEDSVLVLRLPCKELENLLLMQPAAIFAAARKALEGRGNGEANASLTPEAIEAEIDRIAVSDDIVKKVRFNWIANWIKVNKRPADAGCLAKAEEEFLKLWAAPMWRHRVCPGKEVLSRLKSWLQQKYHVSFPTLKVLFESYVPTADIRELFSTMYSHLSKGT